MSSKFVAVTMFVATLLGPTPTGAESLSTCDEIKKTSGTKAYLSCVARQFRNNVPSPGHGMTMDEIETQTDKVLDGICNGPDTVCDGEKPGTKIGQCVCR
jgi:hypothetical protein